MRSPKMTASCTRRGSVTTLVAICLVAMIGILAIAIDGSLLMNERRHAQAVADAAALSAAIDLYQTTNKSVATSNAKAIAASNGYQDGVNSTITVHIPPTSGDHAGQDSHVEVIVQFNQGRFFSTLFGSGSLPVQARAVARGSGSGGGGVGLLLLNKTAQGALTASGGGAMVTSGPIAVNSNNSKAAVLSGSAAISGPEIDITGSGPGYSTSGGSQFTSTSGSISTGVAATADPYTTLAVPDPSTMTVRSSSKLSINSGSTVLQPGRYVGGIKMSGGNVTLAPGIYYLDGGGLSLSGNASLIGQGVMIYNAAHSSSDVITMSGGTALTLSAPQSGPYQGIVLFQDRNSTAGLSLSGSSTTSITGSIYAAGSDVSISGGSGSTVGSQYICDTLKISGSGIFNVGWNGTKTPPTKDIRRVE